MSGVRLLNGTLLNALQQTTVNDVQLLRLRVEQTYVYTRGHQSAHQRRQRPHSRQAPHRDRKDPAHPRGRRLLLPTPAIGLNRYKDALAANAYFKQVLLKTNGVSLKSLAPPQISPFTGKHA